MFFFLIKNAIVEINNVKELKTNATKAKIINILTTELYFSRPLISCKININK